MLRRTAMRGLFSFRDRASEGAHGLGQTLRPLPRAPVLRRLDRRRRRAGRRRRRPPGAVPDRPDRRLLRRDRAPPRCAQGHHGRAGPDRPAQGHAACSGSATSWPGTYDADYVARRWRVGWRHVEIGLEQVYTNVALSRLRTGLIRALHESWQGDAAGLEGDGPLAQQASGPRPGDHRGRLPGRVHGAAPAQRAAGDARPGRRRRRPRAAQPAQRGQDVGLLPAQRPQPHAREEGRAPAADRAATSSWPTTSSRPCPTSPRCRCPTCGRSPSSRWCARSLEINPPGDSIEVDGRLPAGLPPALGDADQLRIVLGNLIRNARDAMPQGGRLTIAARAVDGAVEVSVADTGRRHRAEGPGPDHGAALLDQGPGPGPGACHRPVDPGKEPGQSPRGQRAGPRQHLHDPTDRRHPAMERPHDAPRRTPGSSSSTTTWTSAATCPTS